METTEIKKEIKSSALKIAEAFKPEKIILFGSWAWGKPGPDSDVDLFILKETDNTRRLAGDIRGFLWSAGFPMDIMVYTQDNLGKSMQKGNFFIRDIISRGEILYER